MHRVFVYGTLKQGFANFHVNAGRRVPGEFRTVDRLPLYVIGDIRVPWLVAQPGEGFQVIGQVFEVDDTGLQAMDRLEQVDEDGWYTRAVIQVQPLGADPSTFDAFVYFGAASRLLSDVVHEGPLPVFTAEQNLWYRPAPSVGQPGP